ncbi:MAG: hypothetical protein H6Q58_2315 [Firmicutes bacterium]|nr:hypothetical protein [Bacillota bacterium]
MLYLHQEEKNEYGLDETIVRTALSGAGRRSNYADSRLREKLSGKTAMGDGTLKILLKCRTKGERRNAPKLSGKRNRGYVGKETRISFLIF